MNGLPARAPALGTAAVLVAIYGIGLYPLLLLGLWWGGAGGDCAAGRSPAAAGPELRPGGGAGGPPRLSAGAPGTLSDLYTGGLAWEAAPRLPCAGRKRDAR